MLKVMVVENSGVVAMDQRQLLSRLVVFRKSKIREHACHYSDRMLAGK
jgi:hypothetical protein